MPAKKLDPILYLKQLRTKVNKPDRAQFPSFLKEASKIKKLAALPVTAETYALALALWRDLAKIQDDTDILSLYGKYNNLHPTYVQSFLWHIAPIALNPNYLTKEVAQEITSQSVITWSGNCQFIHPLGEFYSRPDLPGVDYELLWQNNPEASPYIALEWMMTNKWPKHRPLRWGLSTCVIPRLGDLGVQKFAKQLSGPDLDQFLTDLDPELPVMEGLLDFLKLIKPHTWKGLSKASIAKLLKLKDSEIRLLTISQAVGSHATPKPPARKR